jgi:Ni,Fe-hydrogenase III large subunit/Ni,Fe-hydrogenase III component G
MKIIEILKKFPEIQLLDNGASVINASASRNDLARIVTLLVDKHDFSLSLLYGTDDRKIARTYGVHVVLSLTGESKWLLISTTLPENDPTYQSITATVMAAHWYERYMTDMFGIVAVGHPDPRRLVHHENIPEGTYPLRKDFAWNTKLSHDNVVYPMHHVKGEGIYEIPVGPIHAGIIEPGHFRFNVAGERILTLEGKLFFTHKGIEKLMEGKSPQAALPYIEGLSGDMAASHALAYVQAVEQIANCRVTERSQMLRMLICELERITMHIHDLANIGGMGTGYSFIAANGFRIKEKMMRLSDELLGNRFWKGFIVPGGVNKDLTEQHYKKIREISRESFAEIQKIVNLALTSDGFLDRLQTTGVLPLDAAKALGALGIAARGSGLAKDVRTDHPYALYEKYPVKMALKSKGDVHSRYLVRIDELKTSMELVEKLIAEMVKGEITTKIDIKDGFALGAVESWRGEILCVVYMKGGVIQRCFPRDPSFCNWALFGIMGPGNIVPDFPLINKSLNLSYSGTDL